MRKLLSRFFVLAVLLGSLGLFSANALVPPPCPENCHTNCKSAYDTCVAGCPNDPCITNCKSAFDACWAYCNWVCGPA